MLVSFLESFKYLGHMYPIAFLRVYLGVYFLDLASVHYNGEFTSQPQLADMISQWAPSSSAPLWYQNFLMNFVSEQWHYFSIAISVTEMFIGISFLIGYLVRPFGIVAALIGLNFMWLSSPDQTMLFKALICTVLVMTWVGAGRCFGVDYYFYKKMRGWLW